MTDLAGHRWGLGSEEMGKIVREQDQALAKILRYLDHEIGDYIVVVTADHGSSPLPQESEAWPINQSELKRDLNMHFGLKGQKLISESTASGLLFNRDVAARSAVSPRDVARFLNGYTIEENWPEESLPEGYEDRGDELVMATAFPSSEIGDLVSECT